MGQKKTQMELSTFLDKIKSSEEIDFKDTMTVIDENYSFTPTAFKNGNTANDAGKNSGSCKLFAFAQLNKLTEPETLKCFGAYYNDVLKNPSGDDHQNIRNFITSGWKGISFEGNALTTN